MGLRGKKRRSFGEWRVCDMVFGFADGVRGRWGETDRIRKRKITLRRRERRGAQRKNGEENELRWSGRAHPHKPRVGHPQVLRFVA